MADANHPQDKKPDPRWRQHFAPKGDDTHPSNENKLPLRLLVLRIVLVLGILGIIGWLVF